VTGRTAGHGLTAATYFDVDGAIAENGGVICEGETRRIVSGYLPETFEKIKQVFAQVAREFPRARVTDDNFMRLTDQTFHVTDFTADQIARAKQIANEQGLAVIYSSIHLHICDPKINKGSTLKPYLEQKGIADMAQVLTIGDSPNDEGFFDTDLFPNSVGVQNVADYLDRLTKRPRYILPEREGHGFASLAKAILAAKA
jgi:hypothetical protein